MGIGRALEYLGDKTSGEVVESYTMLTINTDECPIVSRMHKPDLKLGNDEQDKRSVIAIEMSSVDQLLNGSRSEAHALIKPPNIKHLQWRHLP